MEPVAFVGAPCIDENGTALGDTAPVFRKVFDDEILNDLFAYKPDYELVEVDGEDEKWYKFTWSLETTYESIYAESYLQELAGKKSALQTAVKEANNGSDTIELTVSPETQAEMISLLFLLPLLHKIVSGASFYAAPAVSCRDLPFFSFFL